MIDWRTLFEQAAEALSGRPVLLRFIQPPTVGGWGECYIEGRGVACVDILPTLALKDRYETLLHEVAHILDMPDPKYCPDMPVNRFIPGGQAITPDIAAEIGSPNEQKMDEQVAKWDRWAAGAAAHFAEADDTPEITIGRKLIALKHYKELRHG